MDGKPYREKQLLAVSLCSNLMRKPTWTEYRGGKKRGKFAIYFDLLLFLDFLFELVRAVGEQSALITWRVI
jgi:hypothetical protein